MFVFMLGIKKRMSPLESLQIADRTLRDAGYNVFAPATPGNITVGAAHEGMGIMVSVIALDADGGTATAITTVCSAQSSADTAGRTAGAVFHNIDRPQGGQVHIPRLPHL